MPSTFYTERCFICEYIDKKLLNERVRNLKPVQDDKEALETN